MNLSISIPSGPSFFPFIPQESLEEKGARGASGHGCPPLTGSYGVSPSLHSRGPAPRRAEIPPGKSQHGAGPHHVPKLVTSSTLRTPGEGRSHLQRGAVGTGHGRTVRGDPKPRTGQHPPRFCGPAPGPRRWKPRPRPRPPRLPPCPACPGAPLSSPPASGRNRGPRRAGRTRPGTAPTCRGWPRTSTLRRAEGWGWPQGSPLRSPCPVWHSGALPKVGLDVFFGWKWSRVGGDGGKGGRRGDADPSGCRDVVGAKMSPNQPAGGQPKGDLAPGGGTAQGSSAHAGDTRGDTPAPQSHPPKSWVPVFSSSRYITFLRTTQP